MIIDKL